MPASGLVYFWWPRPSPPETLQHGLTHLSGLGVQRRSVGEVRA